MQTGYYSATGGMATQFNRLDIISNNLANLNTNGFKRDDVVISDYMRLFQEHQDTLPINDHSRASAKFINRTLDRIPIIGEEYTDKSVGAIMQTENNLDFALNKPNAFFAIQTPSGVAYTRNGSFSISDEGFLVTKEGFKVLSKAGVDNGGGVMLNSSMLLNSDKNGNLEFRELSNEGLNESLGGGSLAVVSFVNSKFLKKVGNGLYIDQKDANDNNLSLANPYINENSNSVMQGYIEKSNVNAVVEMTNMIETNRLVDMYSKVMKTHMDDLNQEAINKLAVRG